MRARNIKPGFFKNEQLSECSFEARLLFPGLWMLADRSGRMEYRPKRIKAEIFPFDNMDVVALVAELEKNGLVVVYEANSVKYLWIPGFLKHQVPHHKEKQSVIPPHPRDIKPGQDQGEPTVDPGQDQGEPTVDPGQDQGEPGNFECQPPLNPESLILNPDSTTSASTRARNDKFQMTPEWKPSEFFSSLAETAGIVPPDGEHLQSAMQEFIPFWLTQNRQRTAHEWDLAFIKALKSGFATPKKNNNKGNRQLLSPRQQYMEDVSNLLENIDEATNNGHPTRLGQAAQPLSGGRPQRNVHRKIGV